MIKIQEYTTISSTDKVKLLRVKFSHNDKNAILLTSVSKNLYNDKPVLDEVILSLCKEWIKEKQ